MRQRLVAAFVGLTVLVVALFGIPRAYLLGDLVRADEQARVDRTADALGRLLEERLEAGRPITSADLDALAAPGERLGVVTADGTVLSGGDPSRGEGEITAKRDLSGGGDLTVTRTGAAVDDEVDEALLPLVVLGLLLALLAGAVGFVLAGRLSRPFRELAVVARGLGDGRLHPVLPRHAIPEARAIGDALVEAGRRLDGLLLHERELTLNASHELRTPVTALRLELEDLALWPEVAPAAADELRRCVAELDRLEAAISTLLERAESRRARDEVEVDLDALLGEAVARRADPAVTHAPARTTRTRVSPGMVLEVLDLMVEDALAAGATRVELAVVTRTGHHELRVSPVPGGVRVGPDEAVGDEGAWARASDLAVAAGGQLARNGATRLLRLPLRSVAEAPEPTQ